MGVNYSTTACKKSCWAISQRQTCGCMEYKFPKTKDFPVCDTLNKTVEKCLRKVKNDFKQGKLNCSNSCPPPCRESTFKLTTSYSLWPTKSYEEYYKLELQKRTKEVDGNNNFRANVLKLNIFFEELNYEVISEELSYELANFVSDLGGTLGLWIGMSVLSFAEIFEFLLLMCYTLARKLKRRMNAKSSTIAVEMFAE
ncbi:ligand-gated sodium channel [Desmophyllum pertusum]|uniref:Ligand-gated sodium channel n=1 Tax=Desmophyllum pertusum TaxID=174260 RepID=A0A9W9ZSY2_9CNID|nr:ligand-gated sodium channel [Desmophyllum pertusum]